MDDGIKREVLELITECEDDSVIRVIFAFMLRLNKKRQIKRE